MSTSDPTPHGAHIWGQAPLSPPSPTSSNNNTTISANSKRPVVQPTLPSSPAPSHSSVDAPPNIDVLSIAGPTPPASVPMSAQQSQSSANDTTLYSPPADQIHSLQSSSGLQSQKINFENQLQSVAGSKRRIENDDEDQTPSKRVRMNDPEQDERFEKPSLEEQIRNLGPLFNVNQKPTPFSKPHGYQDLIALYDLEDIASSVARRDDNNEKINKLRKSYENYLKDIPGRDKKREQNFELRNLMFPPDEEYHIQRVGGKELSNGLTDSMLARLEKATNMGSGKLPESEAKKWRSIIDKDGAKPQPQQSIVEKKRAPEPPSQNSPISPTTSEPARPSRRGVKRSYQDDSFEGYRESFAEDGRETSAVDNVDDGDPSVHGKRKQRRRDTAGSPKYPDFGPNGLNNAVSVGGYGGR